MLISFNWQTNYLFIPLAMAIMFDIRYIVTDSYKNKVKDDNTMKNDIIENAKLSTGIAILNTMIMFLGQTTNGLLEFLRANSKKKSKQIVSKYQYLWLFVAASLDLASFIFLNFIIGGSGSESGSESRSESGSGSVGDLSLVLRMSQTLFIGLLMYPILKAKLYKHNILAISVITFCLIIFIIAEGNKDNILNVFYYLFSYFLNSLRIVVMKILMEKYFYSTYKELLFIGIIGNVEILIGLLFEMIIHIKSSDGSYLYIIFGTIIPQIFSEFSSAAYFITMYLSGALFNTFGTLTNELLSSAHVGIGDTLAGLMFVFVKKVNVKAGFIILDIILNIIILISCFVFTEIIILHFWNLKRDTTNAITERANEERANSLIFINNLDKNNENEEEEEEEE